jgi:CheY-like chemotaxis protein
VSSRSVKSVLLVENDRAWAMLTCEAFADVAPDVSVEWCRSGHHALARLCADPQPDAVMLDLNLPDIDGMDVLRSLQSCRCTAQIPIIVVSASVAAGDREEATTRGATAYREKPVSYTALRSLAHDIASGTFAPGPGS